MKRRLVLLVTSMCAVSAALATTYVRVEKDGTKTYSDRPLPGGKPVELEPAQTYPAPTPGVYGDTSVPAEQRALQTLDDFKYTSCSVTPAYDTSFTNPESVAITVQLEPNLRATDVVTLSVDGKVVGNTLSHVLQPADRGSHTAEVLVKDTSGRELCRTGTVFHVFRPSLLMPGRR